MSADLKPLTGADMAPDTPVLSVQDLTVAVRTQGGLLPLIRNISFDLA
ncbi:MAG: peptide/nickel transport system ATP-binding protein, partial [Loktanella salsilacus]